MDIYAQFTVKYKKYSYIYKLYKDEGMFFWRYYSSRANALIWLPKDTVIYMLGEIEHSYRLIPFKEKDLSSSTNFLREYKYAYNQ